jgi:nucleoside 2-deoxyribosyltransferase
MLIYLASPIASTKSKENWSESGSKLSRNEIISKRLEHIGLDVYLPQINQRKTGEETLNEQLEIIKKCAFLVLVLSDTRGIYIEAGYAKALGKKVIAIEVEETRKYSDWLSAFCDYIAKDLDELINYIKNNKL